MLEIPCPFCGPRAELEFLHGGEATERPSDPSVMSPDDWNAHLHTRTNAKGLVRERWWHGHGCRQWVELERDTTTNRFVSRNA